MTTKQEKLDLLAGVPLFADLGKKDLGRILDAMKESQHPEGEEVVTEGRSGLGFHLIVEGKASVIRNGRTAAKLGPGEFFGELALVDDGPRSASVLADTDLTTLVLSKWEFRPMLKDHPEIAWELIEHLVTRVREEQSGRDALVC